MNTLSLGTNASRTLTVDLARTIDFLGENLRIYATPQLVSDVEHTCLDCLLQHLGEGENSVGTGLSVRHEAATPLGEDVRIDIRVRATDGRRVEFVFEVHDRLQQIASGTHERFVVNVEKLQAKVKKRMNAET